MTMIETYRLPRLIVSAGVLACALVALPLAFGSQPDGSPALKVVHALASGDGDDHDGGDHDAGHDGDHGDRSEHGSSGGHDGDDDGYDDSHNDRYQNDDRNS